MWRVLAFVAAVFVCGSSAPSAAAETYPVRPVRIIVPYGPGGIADVVLRLVAQKLSEKLGQQFVIENRPGAAGIVGIQAVVTSAPDGYTLAMIGGGLTSAKSLFKTLPYDLESDLAPISSTAYYSLVAATKQGSPYKTVGDVIAAAKANPGKLNFGTISPGSTQHLSAELFKTMAGIAVTMIPYKTTPELVTAVIRGDIDVAFDYQAGFEGALSDRQVVAIATTGGARSLALPDVPTVAEGGLKGYDVTSWNGLAAPARTPVEILALINQGVNEALADPAIKAASAKFGLEARGSTREEMRLRVRDDVAKWAKVIADAGIERK
jgi:tripartite-type tricarboxylate transporter receptor subunit TctC